MSILARSTADPWKACPLVHGFPSQNRWGVILVFRGRTTVYCHLSAPQKARKESHSQTGRLCHLTSSHFAEDLQASDTPSATANT